MPADVLERPAKNTPHCPGFDTAASTVLYTDAARGLTYTWHDISPDKQDRSPREKAIETSALIVTSPDGERVACLRVSFTTAEFVQAAFSRPLHFAEVNGGRLVGFGAALAGYREPLTLIDIWVKAHHAWGKTPVSILRSGKHIPYYSLNANNAPDEQTMNADLKALEDPIRKDIKAWTRWFSVPYVAYSQVNENLRRTGIARQMYLLAAQRLATTGRVLSASGLQSDEAAALWASLAADPAMPTGTVSKTDSRTGKTRTYLTVDCRAKRA